MREEQEGRRGRGEREDKGKELRGDETGRSKGAIVSKEREE